jgi:uncharacterized repeat protein (TIGR01451 family)
MRPKEANIIEYLTSMYKEVIIMKIYKPIRLLGLLTVGAAMWGLSLSAFALGTASGLPVDNQSSLSYSVGGVGQTDIWSTGNTALPGFGGNGTLTRFLVDNKVIVTVAEVGATATTGAPGQTVVVTTFTVSNTGNTVQDYGLASANEAVGQTTLYDLVTLDDADVTLTGVFVEDGTTPGTYQALEDTATYIDELAADASITVYVVVTIPGALVDTNYAVVSLLATTEDGGAAAAEGAVTAATAGADDPTVVDVVFADVAGTDDAATDGIHSSRDAYLVGSAQISVSKTVSNLWWNDAGLGNATLANPKAIPGAYLQYTVTIANAGGATASATLTTITDTLVATLAHDPDFIAAGTGLATNAAGDGFSVTHVSARPVTPSPSYYSTANDADGVELAGAVVTATFATVLPVEAGYTAGELKPGESVSVIFNVIVQ